MQNLRRIHDEVVHVSGLVLRGFEARREEVERLEIQLGNLAEDVMVARMREKLLKAKAADVQKETPHGVV